MGSNSINNKILLYNGITTAYAKSDNSPSLSLMAISAMLKKYKYDVELIFDRDNEQILKNKMQNSLLAGFSVYTGNGINKSINICEKIKKINSDFPIVWGGYHPSLDPDQCLESQLIDFVVRGQGEHTIIELIEHIKDCKNKPVRNIKGISFRENDEIIHNENRMSQDMAEFPILDYDLYHYYYHKHKLLSYITSRGCPFNCHYCNSFTLNNEAGCKFLSLSAERIEEDINFIIRKYDPVQITFWDDVFFFNKKKLLRFIDAYKRNNWKFEWVAFGRVNFFNKLDDDIFKQLIEINMKKLSFGAESGSQKILDLINKKTDSEALFLLVDKLNKFDKKVEYDFSFINGFPYEDYSDIRESLKLRNYIKNNLSNVTCRFFVLNPFPKTKIMDMCIEQGFNPPGDLSGWKNFEYHSFKPTWHKKKYQKYINNIAWASFLDAIIIKKNTPINIILKLMQAISRFRLKNNKLQFAPELQIFNKIYTFLLERN